jgi:hypothetical protein
MTARIRRVFANTWADICRYWEIVLYRKPVDRGTWIFALITVPLSPAIALGIFFGECLTELER